LAVLLTKWQKPYLWVKESFISNIRASHSTPDLPGKNECFHKKTGQARFKNDF